ncbi:hypothetical protein CBS147347_10318 [Aspergillus niger]|nr:hypothetical protein CBS147347_10318 [Aspergillus niger]
MPKSQPTDSYVLGPVYQAGSILRSVLVVRAYLTQTNVDYHSSIMPLHGFVYTRALIFLLGTMGPTRSFVKNVNAPYVYAESVLGAALISVGHCHGSWSVPTYLVLVHAIGKLSLRIREKYEFCREKNIPEPHWSRILRKLGFCTRVGQEVVPNAPLIGHLPTDMIGAIWTEYL